MSFFSRSRSKGYYPNHSHGSDYYKRPHNSGGILGKIIDLLTGSKRHSGSYSNKYNGRYPKHGNGHYPSRHRRKSSWS